MAWGRKLRLEARNADGVQVDISELRVDSRCIRSRVFDDNELEATIVNASEDTISKFLKRGTNIALYAGYEDEGTGLMYQGNIIDSKTNKVGTNSFTIIRSMALRSLTRPFTATPVCLGFPPGSNAEEIIDSLGAILGLVPIGKEMAAQVVFKSGWTYVGPVSGAFKRLGQDLRTNGMGLYVDLAELVVFKFSGDSTYSIAFISPQSGLLVVQNTTDYISAAKQNIASFAAKTQTKGDSKNSEVILKPEETDDAYSLLDKVFTNMKKTYSATTQVLPKLRPNSLVHLSEPAQKIDGLFVINRMEIMVGNGPKSSFVMNLDLIEA